MKQLFTFILMAFSVITYAQIDNPGMSNVYDSIERGKVSVGAFIDVYYGFDFNRPLNSDRPYCVSSSRHNEININIAYADFRFINDKVRAHFVPGFGNYINSNYAAENGTLKNLVEANVGVKLMKDKEVWIDAGVLPSPYTNESAVSKDHLMYTRSLAPEYVPYYLTGIKLSLPLHKKIQSYWYLLNGWQSIQDVNDPLSMGTQIEYRPGKKVLLNWDTYIGDESSKMNPHFGLRYFTDLYLIYNPEGKLSITSCIYAGLQKKKDSLGIRSEAQWWQANIMAKYAFSKKTSLSGRIEFFEDASSLQIKSITGIAGFSTYSGGLCLNVKLGKNALFRFEGRTFFSEKKVFLSPSRNAIQTSNLLISNLSVWF